MGKSKIRKSNYIVRRGCWNCMYSTSDYDGGYYCATSEEYEAKPKEFMKGALTDPQDKRVKDYEKLREWEEQREVKPAGLCENWKIKK